MRRISCIILIIFLTATLEGCTVYTVIEVTATPSATSAPVVTNTPPAATPTQEISPPPSPLPATQEIPTPSPSPQRQGGEIGEPLNANHWLRPPATSLVFGDSPPRFMEVPAAFRFFWRAGGYTPHGFAKVDPDEAGDTVLRWDFAWIAGSWCYGQDGLILQQGARYLLRAVYNTDVERANGGFETSDLVFVAHLNNASGGTTVDTYAQDVAGAQVQGGEVLWVIQSDRPAPMLQYQVCVDVRWADFSKAVLEWDSIEIRRVPDGYGDVVVAW